MSAFDEARARISQASRILAGQGVLDAFGHVSCRSPENPERFLISRSMAPALVTPEDVVELALAGDPVAPDAPPLFLERFIHGELYRLRPEVHSVVHSHALPVMPFAAVPGAVLRPVSHMCGFLHDSPATFDVADHAGPSSNLLITSRDLGRKLAEHLGSANVVLMRSHGFTCVGGDVPQAVYRAIYTMKNCEIALSARQLGEPVYLSAGEAAACERTIAGQIDRAWNLWISELGG